MVKVDLDEVIEKPVDEVFERLVDLDDYSKWLSKWGIFTRSWQTSEGPVGKGTTYDDKGKMGTFHGDVADYESPRRVVFREDLKWLGSRVMEARPGYELEAEGDRTKIHFHGEGELYGAYKIMQPMMVVMGKHERKRTLKALKRSLES